MAISRERKEQLVGKYTDLINDSSAIFITEYKGQTVAQLQELRGEIRKADGAYHVTKSTLLKIALERAGKPVPTDLMEGQIATGFALGEAPALAKALSKYAEAEEGFMLRGGVMDTDTLTADQVEALAKLPSLDQLRATLLGLLNAPARDVASVVASGVRQVVNVVDAYSKKEEAEVAA